MQLVIVYDGFEYTIGPDGLFFGTSSLRASFHNFGMASPCFLLKISVFVLKVTFGVWRLAFVSKEMSSMKQQIHAQTFEPS